MSFVSPLGVVLFLKLYYRRVVQIIITNNNGMVPYLPIRYCTYLPIRLGLALFKNKKIICFCLILLLYRQIQTYINSKIQKVQIIFYLMCGCRYGKVDMVDTEVVTAIDTSLPFYF